MTTKFQYCSLSTRNLLPSYLPIFSLSLFAAPIVIYTSPINGITASSSKETIREIAITHLLSLYLSLPLSTFPFNPAATSARPTTLSLFLTPHTYKQVHTHTKYGPLTPEDTKRDRKA